MYYKRPKNVDYYSFYIHFTLKDNTLDIVDLKWVLPVSFYPYEYFV